MCTYRIEPDTLGAVQVPAEALYGAQTQRAVDNFPLSGRRLPAPFMHALGLIKHAAAQVNAALGLLEEARARAQATSSFTPVAMVRPLHRCSANRSYDGIRLHTKDAQELALRAGETAP